MLDLAAIRPALRRENIGMRRMTLLAEGSVEGSGEPRRFRIRGWPVAFPLAGAGAALPGGPQLLAAHVRIVGGVPHLRPIDP